MLACLALPEEIFARPGFIERVQTLAAQHEAPRALGPSREPLAALVS
jgi:hypothetical protein